MSALVSKEVRLVLPAYAMALVLAVAPIWLFPNPESTASDGAVVFFWFGAAMLALSSFGREFGMNTFSLILVQPLERARIWRAKVGVLAGAMASLLAAWCLSWAAAVPLGRGRSGLGETLAVGGVSVAVALAGGLWTTLLFRQVAAAFWFTLLVPGAIVVLTTSARTPVMVTYAALLAYSAGGFWLAWWQFHRAQETGWTGGLVALTGWRRSAAASTTGVRARRSLRALLWKELQLHQVGLAGMALLFLLHLGVVAIRKAGAQALGDNVRAALEMFGAIWLIVPLVLASASVAEERKLGTMDSMMCQPVSTRLQFGIKLLFALVLGGLLSAALLWTAESIGASFGVGTIIGGPKPSIENLPVLFPLSGVFLALALIGFYASTASRHIVQAMAVAVAASLGLWMAITVASRPLEVFGVLLWGSSLAHYVGLPTLVGCFLWLAWRNFKSVSGGGGLWRQNLLALAGSLVFIAGATSLLYNRAWEWVTPLEAAHGPAKIAGPNAVHFSSYGGSALLAVMSDGRLWVDQVAYYPGRPIMVLYGDGGICVGGKWTSLSGNHFVAGTNWVDAAANYKETIGIRSDGLLWVSEKPRRWREDAPFAVEDPAPLVRFGAQTDWQGVARDYTEAATLLKKDGTLWSWGTNSWSGRAEWPGFRSFQPRRLGTESDWAKILSNEGLIYLWKADGSAWWLHHTSQPPRTGAAEGEPGTVIERMRGLDNLRWQSLARFRSLEAGVREDGTLWGWKLGPPAKPGPDSAYSPKLAQVGKDTDWCAVGGGHEIIVALKADGSIWTWEFSRVLDELSRLLSGPPTQLGSRRDWVAVGNYWAGAVTLAADGSLWFWHPRGRGFYAPSDQPLLAPSRRPAKIENILEGRN